MLSGKYDWKQQFVRVPPVGIFLYESKVVATNARLNEPIFIGCYLRHGFSQVNLNSFKSL